MNKGKERLIKLRDGLKTLKKEEFSYSRFVSFYEEGCGTVCCAAGWISEENDPKFITTEDFEAIEALTGKIEHMTLYIGCPNSVEPMLRSIANRNLKRWVGVSSHENDYAKGKQIRSRDSLARYAKSFELEMDEGRMIITGHFRWNNRGYLLSRRATDLLGIYINK